VLQDFSEGLKWYRRAADGGNPQAQFNLGVINYNGKGVPQSNVRAHMWFNLAAANFPPSDSRNREIAANVRDVVAMKMNREEVADAQKLARDWRERQSTAEPNK
ncbi:MAG: tetratricopeptide repeat protein, partial [Pseudorhodoplanes sp.]